MIRSVILDRRGDTVHIAAQCNAGCAATWVRVPGARGAVTVELRVQILDTEDVAYLALPHMEDGQRLILIGATKELVPLPTLARGKEQAS